MSNDSDKSVNVDGWWMPLVLSIILTPFLLLAGLASTGFGHGDYFWATLLFPYTMLSRCLLEAMQLPAVLFVPSVFVAIVQFPIYGGLLSYSARRGRMEITTLIIFAAHTLSALAAFCLDAAFL